VHDHATGDGPKDQRACEQDRSDHAKAAEDAPHHVITNYQRPSLKKRSLEDRMAVARSYIWAANRSR
jgi:hypothetical protein